MSTITEMELALKEEITTASKNAYMNAQTLCGLKVGDTVKVLRKAESYELGWCNVWRPKMDDFIGSELCVREIKEDVYGVKLSLGIYTFYFPFFVLEKIEEASAKPKETDVVIGIDYYSCHFFINGDIRFGCQKIPWKLVKKIYKTAKKERKQCK